MVDTQTNILVVDDHLDNLRTLDAILKNNGYRVRKATSGEMALETIRSQQPDIILLDIRMPRMDGYAVCATLKSSPDTREIPVIFLSALDDTADKVKAFETGGADYITKPFHVEEVLVRIRHQITIQRQQRQLLQQNRQLQREMQERRLLSQVIQHIRQSLHLNEILQVAVDEVRQLLHVDRVLICRFNPDWTGQVVAESVRSAQLSLQGTIFDDPRFQAYWAHPDHRHSVSAITQVSNSDLPSSYAEFLAQHQIQARLVYPILLEDMTWGIWVAHECDRHRPWRPWELNFCQHLTEQLAVAVQQSQLYQEVQQFNQTLEHQVCLRTTELQQALEFESTLKRITDKVRDSLDETEILRTAVEELAKALKAHCCDTALYDADQQASIIRYQYAEPSQPASEGQILHTSEFPDLYEQLQRGIEFAFCQLVPSNLRNHSAIFACPITDNQGILGDLWLFKPTSSSFSEPEIRLVQQVANQCAIAIRQARLYQAAQAQVVELQHLDRLKEDFLSNVSHELRTPIANIRMVIRLLLAAVDKEQTAFSHLSQSETKVAQYLKILHDECERELSLVQDLLDFQRLKAGGRSPDLVAIDLALWLPGILEPFELRMHNQDQRFTVEIDPGLPHLTTDKTALLRIINELLNNACKYTPARGAIAMTVSQDGEFLRLTISNSGVEIPEDQLSLIFGPFYQVPQKDHWKHGGTGLGLALIKQLVEHLGGSIQVNSRNAVTWFTVKLPIHPPSQR